jgi:hypothetical protein
MCDFERTVGCSITDPEYYCKDCSRIVDLQAIAKIGPGRICLYGEDYTSSSEVENQNTPDLNSPKPTWRDYFRPLGK